MALDFPTSPTNGQKFPASPIAGIATYTFDGVKWTTSGPSLGIYVQKAGDTMTGDLTIANSSTNSLLNLSKPNASAANAIIAKVGTSRLWQINMGDGSATQDFALAFYNDADAIVGAAITVSRTDGLPKVMGDPVSPIGVATKRYVDGRSREKLTANRTYFVSTSGSDSNDGLTAGAPLLTIQKAYEAILKIDCNGFAPTIKLGAGMTFTNGLITSAPLVGYTDVSLDGSGSTIRTTNNDCIFHGGMCGLLITNVVLNTVTAGHCVHLVGRGVRASIGTGVVFGACASSHMRIESGAGLTIVNPYTITGGATTHYQVLNQGMIDVSSMTIVSSGTLAFSTFADCEFSSVISAFGMTYSGGTITGTRYVATMNSIINTFGGGINVFPGSIAGSVQSGGQYL